MKLLEPGQSVIALGLMSGTSLDGIDAALIETDGANITDFGPSLSLPYSDAFRSRLKAAVEEAGLSDKPVSDDVLVKGLTDLHAEAVQNLIGQQTEESKWKKPSIVGFHGHTTLHRPLRGYTQQIGDSRRLSDALGLRVVSDFRRQDVEAGGEGAPLVPIFHYALSQQCELPTCFVNVGGIANITWIGSELEDELIAFDTGTGNGLLDAWIEQKTGDRFDDCGRIAAQGRADPNVLRALMSNPYFDEPFPKSLDRSDFNLDVLNGHSVEDGAATLVAFTVNAIVRALNLCPSRPKNLYVTGGGRHNKTIMSELEKVTDFPVYAVEREGWAGDFIEAQAFAFLAVRSYQGLPITFPKTTGCKRPMTGGKLTCPVG